MQDKSPLSTFGPDLNEYSQNVNFKLLAKNSDFIYLRTSGSGSGKFRLDKKFIEFAKQCRLYGIPCGGYHYALPTTSLEAADVQAIDFANALEQGFGKKDFGDLFPVVDVETPVDKSLTTTQLIAWVERFKKTFEKKTRRKLMLYTGLFFIQFYNNFKVPGRGYPLSKMPLWIALYTKIPTNPRIPPNAGGWTRWTMWQYTENGKIDGVDNPLDLNWGPNSLDELMPPAIVKGLYAYDRDKNIDIYWTANKETDLDGYNLFVNSEYVATAPPKATRITVSKKALNLIKGKSIKITIEAFDKIGDVSAQRTEYILD
ncbi:glycoside hydrolase family 25 protein [Clostridium tarantellae]|uniref:Muramidase n=1 Tax=Clostridium tarantellae TaxID=39493 RepID=A0A6I1MM41_9CLOT|nr:glycoside hydrolase family 25 protein [Clostridium tarantellae]MPQ43187.1 muramidase [Clostridium tarantellae]